MIDKIYQSQWGSSFYIHRSIKCITILYNIGGYNYNYIIYNFRGWNRDCKWCNSLDVLEELISPTVSLG
ncbi:hypothetical protein GLOIN_2v1771450 [Rhizophagus irregularis DAOM 181602=DAOM 197198]|uniref:Uncharacterized protein n=1 Tax=Rhizophagus irregularis (strain DAOM 181602 / DAOM 197198 / MUCL 43194) TaxID=747089 RepID=A0A2P4QA09_RHIID|nr:hypothetical protein GLOIN_2v1771450 [Rhizophagus irregularis DAOM 181602=DAOM 197198]POG74438.1 hypothetical protein GLOIN_2v1771450 [Rhizophagus irregularis DAOM 181602=DAOM 197198]GET61335.1 hypothetical protein GLOIN_2v1771450 [Rhizophagus irregularis DAOM 181602=DAOM 197198]|eukprot:XP_025181304.1 hypothetical protein GLOIN_2v1771450 [Rhizophagus irregularis DAOM 181602=DAOM 197198]